MKSNIAGVWSQNRTKSCETCGVLLHRGARRHCHPCWEKWNRNVLSITKRRPVLFECSICGDESTRTPSTIPPSGLCLKCSHENHTPTIHKKSSASACGSASPHWKGGRVYTERGYVRVYTSSRETDSGGRGRRHVLEHVLVAEKFLGRRLERGKEAVHHINDVRDDNRPENLLVCTVEFHRWLHGEMSRRYIREHFTDWLAIPENVTESQRFTERIRSLSLASRAAVVDLTVWEEKADGA